MAKECKWTQDGWLDEYNQYNTDCGEMFILSCDTPEENDFKFCCYCGRKLMQVLSDKEVDDYE